MGEVVHPVIPKKHPCPPTDGDYCGFCYGLKHECGPIMCPQNARFGICRPCAKLLSFAYLEDHA